LPQPYPGQQWKHGWVPLTPGAARSKNHGRKPGAGSALSRMVAEAAEAHKRMQERDRAAQKDAPKSASPTAKPATRPASKPAQKPAGKPAEAAPTRAASKPAPTRNAAPKTAAKPAAAQRKTGKKVGADLRNAPLREGDEVRIVEGPRRGKTGTVTGKGKYGAIQVEVDGERSDYSPTTLRSTADAETSRRADAAIRQAARRPATAPERAAPPRASTATVEQIQSDIRAVYDQLAPDTGSWVSLSRIRAKLAETLPREQVDEALRKLERRPDVNLVPESNQKVLSKADRDAAVNIGDQDKHLIAFLR
jgi:hypothetical protein